MRVVAATLLAVLGGKANPTADDINKILSSVGIEAEGDSVSRLLSELEGKNIEEVIAAGREKLQAVPSGGGGGGGGGGAAPAAAAAGGAAEAKKEEKKEEPSEEDEDMGFSLFD